MYRVLGSAGLLGLAVAAPAYGDPPAQPSGTRPPAAPTAVQELTVTAAAPQTQTLLDRKVYGVTQNLQATAGSAADVLDQIPSVSVDADGNPSLRGDTNVTILIDGKPSAQFSGATRGLSLQQMAGSDIERIEVLTSPPAQYKAEGSAGVINIITKKTRKAGLSGGAQVSFGDRRRYNLGANANYNVGKLRLSASVGLRQDARERQIVSNHLAADPLSGQIVQSGQTIDETTIRRIPSYKAAVDYDLNSRQTIGAAISNRQAFSGARYFTQQDTSGPPGAAPTSLTDRYSVGHEWSADSSEGLHFEQKLGHPGETLDIALNRSVERERERYAYSNTSTLPAGPETFDDLFLGQTLVQTEFSIDYDLPLSHDREIKLGYDLEEDRNAFDDIATTIDPVSGQAVNNPALTNHFRYRQQVDAFYGQYEQPFGPWRLQAGVRVEAAYSSSLQITGNVAGGRRDLDAYPSLHLERSVGSFGTLSASVSRRVTRPDGEALNPFIDTQDTHNLSAGNASLLPQDTWSYELGYNSRWKSLSLGATAYYRFDRNSITQVVSPVGADVVLATLANLPKSKSAGVEFNAGGKLASTLSFGVSGDAFYKQIDATALGATGLRSTTGVNLKANLDYHPTKADTLQVSLSRTDARLTPQGFIDAINLVNLGYRRQLRPDLAVVATVSDVLNGQRYHRLITTPQLRDDYLRRQQGQIVFVGLVYTFGGQKKAKPAGFEYDQ